jgi:hypothetical protein
MKKNILFVGAQDPYDSTLETHTQFDVINNCIDKTSYWLLKFSLPEVDKLLYQLQGQKISIFHFNGHGCQDGIFFLNHLASYGYNSQSSHDSFINVIKAYQAGNDQPYLECIVLLACNSFEICKELSNHVFCVIGTTKEIEPQESTYFAKNFYTELSRNGFSDQNRYHTALEHAKMLLTRNDYSSFIHGFFNQSLIHNINSESIVIAQNMPVSGVARFVGRKEELQALHEQLQANSQVALSAIAGMGGVGKTELAVQYGILYRLDYPGGICWINSRGSDAGKQIVDFATDELRLQSDHVGNLDRRVRYCWNNWQREGNVLVVFDDVTTYEHIKPYLPPQRSRFKVLITTRKKLEPPVVLIDLDVLSPDDAVELLKSLIGNERVEQELEVAKLLCRWLGYLPLALELVGRYLVRYKTQSIERILAQLQQKKTLRHPATKEATEEMTAQLGLAAAFDLSWDELDNRAKQLGCLLSLFDIAAIPLSLVEKSINVSQSARNEDSFSALEDLRADFADGAEQSSAVSDLVRLNLVRRIGEGTYRLHELILEFFQGKLHTNDFPQSESLQREFSAGMLLVAQQTFESSNFSMPELKALLDFLLQVPTERRNGALLGFLELLSQYYHVQQYIYDTGYLESAIEKLERAKLFLRELGESNNLKAQVINAKMLGHAYYASPAQNRNLAIENMMAATGLAALADRSSTSTSEHQIWLWYQVFLLDHVHNLLSKPFEQTSTLVPIELEVQIAELLPTSLERADAPPELDVLPSLLRAAHYWGHRGNQVTFKLESLLRELPSTRSEEVEALLGDGINYYSRASIFRAANFRLSFPQQYQRHLANILDEIPHIPQWLLTWNPPETPLDFERFTSASQAVGDIAHQYRGMATIQLFGCFYNVSRSLSSSLLEEASSVVDVVAKLWEQARILLTPGEQVIKYYVWTANLEMMLHLMRLQYSFDAQLPSEADVEREVTAKLDELESEYGLVYGWARNQTIRQIGQFHNMISRLNRP